MDDDIWKPMSSFSIEHDIQLLKSTFCNDNISIPIDSPFYIADNPAIIQLKNDISNININYNNLIDCKNKINNIINHSNELLNIIKNTPEAELMNACLKLVSKDTIITDQTSTKPEFPTNSSHHEKNYSLSNSLPSSTPISIKTPLSHVIREKSPVISSIKLDNDNNDEIEFTDGWGDSLEELDIL